MKRETFLKDEVYSCVPLPIMGRMQMLSSSNHNQHQQPQTEVAGSGIISLNTITPCAACKLLRRRCAQECPFSPYFSPLEPHKFASVHKVFGASNVAKMLMEVAENERGDAANSLVYEANLRLRDPVYGCMGAISALQHQIQTLQAELHAIKTEIYKYKYTTQPIILPSSSNTPSLHIPLLRPLPPTGVAVPITTTSPAAPPTPPHSQPPPLSLPPPPPPPPPSSSSSVYSPSIISTTHEFNTMSTQHISYFG